MPKEAKIFIAEDNVSYRDALKDLLDYCGHTVVLEAGSISEALEKTKEAKGLGVNIAILDGDLGSGDVYDGPKIAKILRKEIPGIKIISFSAKPAGWGDVNPGKGVKSFEFRDIIAELLGTESK